MASEKKIKDQQRFNESVKEELKLRELERGVLNQLIDLAKVKGRISNDAKQTQQDLITSLKETVDLESESEKVNSQIEAVQRAKLELIKEAEEKGVAINAHLINQLDHTEKLLTASRERAAINDELMNTTKNILGLDTELEQAIAKGGVAALAMNKAFENVGKSITSMKDGMMDTMHELGVGAGEAAILQGNIEQASWSFTGMMYGADAMANSAKAIAKEYGSVQAATSDMIKAVTEVSTLTGDAASAADLVHVFEQAGVEAGDVKGVISDIANSEGISAQKAMEGMTGQMSQLVGKSKEQLATIIKSNAQMVKQGTTLAQMEDISNNMLDIESSLKKEFKARAMLGRDINASAVRGAALELQSARSEEERAAARKKMSEAILQGVGGMEQFANMTMKEKELLAESYGMSRDELSTMMEKKQTQDELTAKYGKYADTMAVVEGVGKQILSGMGSMTIEMGKVIAKTAIMNMMMGKGSGIGEFFTSGIQGAKSLAKGLASPLKSLGSLKDKAVAAFKGGGKTPDVKNDMLPDTEKLGSTVEDGGKASGKGGMKEKLTDMAEGLKAMGDGKVFAGIGAVALAGPAFIVALPSIPFLLFMGKVKLKALEENFTGLSSGLQAMSKAAVGTLVMMLVGPALAMGLLAIPFLAFMSIPSLGPIISANFTALAAGLAAFGNPATAVFVLIGIGLMAALGAAMIPFAYALSLLSPLVEAFGNVIVNVMSAVPPIIQAVADGFVTMMGALTPEAIGGLLLLGPALLLASVGMVAFSAALLVGGLGSFFGGGIIDDITELAMIGPQLAIAGQGLAAITTNLSEVGSVVEGMAESLSTLSSASTPLFQVAAGLYSIAGGLASVSMAGLLSIPVISGLVGLAAVAPALKSLGDFFGMGGDSSESESSSTSSDNNKELISEIRGLRSDIQSQPIMITVDGRVVSEITKVQNRKASTRTSGYGG